MTPSLRAFFAVGAIAAISVFVLAAAVTFWAFSLAEQKLDRTVRSYDQLALATSIEAEIGRLLIAEVNGIVDPRSPPLLQVAPAGIENAVDELIRKISQEIAAGVDEADRSKEREEFKSAYAIRALFASMQHGIDRQRALVSRLDSGNAVRSFMSSVIAVDYRHLNRIVSEVTADERNEVRERLEEMSVFRVRLMAASAVMLTAMSFVALIAAYSAYRMLMRPLANLGRGSEALGKGDLSHRISEYGPPELARLARRFNDMAERLARQQHQLQQTNDALELTVEERTKELEDKASRLAEIDRSRRLFFAKIGHELRTPLTVLIGEADLALKRKEAAVEEYRQALSYIAASGDYLKRRIVDLMALARSDDGQMQLTREPVNLAALVKELHAIAESYARFSEVDLDVNLAANDAICTGDREWLRQGLLAVVDNAIKFSAAGGTVRIQFASSSHGGTASIWVDDQGPGVPEEDLARLFDPYFQSEAGRTRSGTGLGLAVAKWVAEQHGGDVLAENLDPNGLRVRMELPLAP